MLLPPMKKYIIYFLISVAFIFNVKAQTKFSGYQYLVSSDSYLAIKYTRSYTNTSDTFKTVYKIYHPTKGHHAITITATHIKSQKSITVDVEDAGGGIFSHINSESTKYEEPSMEWFGFRGAVGAMGGKRVPNQLTLKFVSNKYENVKVVHIAGAHENNDFEFFVMDEKN